MENKSLHPSVEQFKAFIKEHPHLIKSVRNEENTWQELYEDWYLLGEDDPMWKKNTESTGEKQDKKDEQDKKWIDQVTSVLKKMDANQVQQHIGQLSQAIGAIQGVLGQFQGENKTNNNQTQANRHPFAFRKD